MNDELRDTTDRMNIIKACQSGDIELSDGMREVLSSYGMKPAIAELVTMTIILENLDAIKMHLCDPTKEMDIKL